MPTSATPASERIARVLAGRHLSLNGEGSDPHAAGAVDAAWPDHVDDAYAILSTLREPDAHMAQAGDVGVWRAMIGAVLERRRGRDGRALARCHGCGMTAPMLKIKVQIYCGDQIAMGPGKADLLDAIAAEGSISAAGRKLGMSYRRCWLLVDVMNRCWDAPLVATSSEGATLTARGAAVLRDYRALQAGVGAAGAQGWIALARHVRAEPLAAQG